MGAPIRLIVVDDHDIVRQGLKTMLAAYGDRFQIVADAATVEEALIRTEKLKPDVVITDLYFDDPHAPKPAPGTVGDGIDLITILKDQQPKVQVILITADRIDQLMVRAYDAGAAAFLFKHAPASEYARAIESVASGFTHFPAQLKTLLDKRTRDPKLTDRECELMPYIARGLTAREIARELSRVNPKTPIIDRTVEVHKGNIKRKFHLGSASALVGFAIEYCQANRINY